MNKGTLKCLCVLVSIMMILSGCKGNKGSEPSDVLESSPAESGTVAAETNETDDTLPEGWIVDSDNETLPPADMSLSEAQKENTDKSNDSNTGNSNNVGNNSGSQTGADNSDGNNSSDNSNDDNADGNNNSSDNSNDNNINGDNNTGTDDTDSDGTESDKPGNEPEVTIPETEATTPSAGGSDFEHYNNMSAEEQKAFMNSFASIDDFFDWYYAAKEEYEANQDYIEVGGGGSVDIGDIINGQG